MHFFSLSLTAALLSLTHSASVRLPISSNIINARIPAEDIVPNSYLLVYKDSASNSDILKHHATIQAVTGSGPATIFNLPGFKGVHVKTNPAGLAKISPPNSIVDYVESDSITSINPIVNTTTAIDRRVIITQNNAPWGLGRISRRPVNSDGSNYVYDSSACENTLVYVIDTGIRITHQQFNGGRAIFGANFVAGSPNNDENGHGTHCAGIVAGATFGVCKKATVIAVKVFNSDGKGLLSGLLAGIQWAYDDQIARDMEGRTVFSMSFSGGFSPYLNSYVSDAISTGIPIVMAAGNENKDAYDVSPASADGGIAVGATNKKDERSSFSNFGSVLSIFAPGEEILSAWYDCDTCTKTLSGTSMSAPHVVGIAAYLIAKEGLSSTDVRNRILNLATSGIVIDAKGGSPNLLAYNGGGA